MSKKLLFNWLNQIKSHQNNSILLITSATKNKYYFVSFESSTESAHNVTKGNTWKFRLNWNKIFAKERENTDMILSSETYYTAFL